MLMARAAPAREPVSWIANRTRNSVASTGKSFPGCGCQRYWRLTLIMRERGSSLRGKGICMVLHICIQVHDSYIPSAMIEALKGAAALIASWDPKLLEIVALSLKVSLSAVFFATLLALPLGAAVEVARFPGRHALIVLLNALMGLPPVVVGLVVYLLLSRAGPLGQFGLLFTPPAMVIAQTILILPIIAALARQAVEDAWLEYQDQLRSLGVSGV